MDIGPVPSSVDVVSISGSKIGALPGIGALWIRDRKLFGGYMGGGLSQYGIREGTLNYPALHTMNIVLQDIQTNGVRERVEKMCGTRSLLDDQILEIPGVTLNFEDSAMVCNTSNYHIEDIDSRRLWMVLKKQGLLVSTSVHGLEASTMPTPITKAMFDRPFGNIRFSVSDQTTVKQVTEAVSLFREAVTLFRRHKLNT